MKRQSRGVFNAGGNVLTTSGVNDKSNEKGSECEFGRLGMDHAHLYSKEG
jgi:hypothetical protein